MTSVPLMLVSSRSSTTTSGLCCSTSLTTSVPSVVQAATLMSGSPSSSARRPSITIAWSSASSTRIMIRASFGGQRDGERRASAGRALECERAAEHLHAILNAAQSEVPPLHADVLFAREHALRLEAAAVVRHGQGDRQAPPLDAHALPGGAPCSRVRAAKRREPPRPEPRSPAAWRQRALDPLGDESQRRPDRERDGHAHAALGGSGPEAHGHARAG